MNAVQIKKSSINRNAWRTVLSNKTYNKVFCIGYNKTGTTTIAHTLNLYGLKFPNQQQQEVRLSKQCYSTNYLEFTRFVEQYDAFQDQPFSQGLTFVAADALFPNSKFILTERNSEDWYNSVIAYHKKKIGVESIEEINEELIIEKYQYLYPGYVHEAKLRLLAQFEHDKLNIDWSLLYNKDYYISSYEKRNTEIKRYFMNASEKLLIIDITKEKNTKKICNFLGIPEKFIIDTPHKNKT